jgi:hypothetical protein
MAGIKWTDEEDAVLAEIYNVRNIAKHMHRLPNRTLRGAKERAARLGLVEFNTRRWPDHEEAIVRDAYANGTPIKEVARMLPHRSDRQIHYYAARIGLRGQFNGKTGSTYSWVREAVIKQLDGEIPLTITELAEKTGASVPGVKHVLSAGHGVIFYIADWDRFGYEFASKWLNGKKKDAPKPPKKTMAESCRDWRAKQNARSAPFDPFRTLVVQVAA